MAIALLTRRLLKKDLKVDIVMEEWDLEDVTEAEAEAELRRWTKSLVPSLTCIYTSPASSGSHNSVSTVKVRESLLLVSRTSALSKSREHVFERHSLRASSCIFT